MADMDEIIRLFSQPDYKADYLDAKARETCIKCKLPVSFFRDNSSKLEYQISALCQKCQDAYFHDQTRDIRGREQKVGNGD